MKFHNRKLYKIHINSSDLILVEDAPFQNFEILHADVKKFIMNNGKDPNLSDNPKDATISLQMNRGTHYHRFIEVMDALPGVYYAIYGERVGLSSAKFRTLDLKIKDHKAKYDKAREGIPMRISIAEPNKIN